MAGTHRKLINDPDSLIEDLIAGMVSAHPEHLTVEGETGRAIVALNGPREGKVGIVVGGGSGHGYKHGIMLGDYVAHRVVGDDRNPELADTFKLKNETF